MKGSTAVIIIIIFVIIIVLGMLGFIFYIKPQLGTGNANSTNATTGSTPSVPIKDFAPEMPMSQKTTITIMSNDSSEEKYIVPTNQIDTYIKQLPPGYHVVSKTQ